MGKLGEKSNKKIVFKLSIEDVGICEGEKAGKAFQSGGSARAKACVITGGLSPSGGPGSVSGCQGRAREGETERSDAREKV